MANADYNEVWRSPEYREKLVESLKNTADKAAFAYHPTYYPFFRKIKNRPGMRLLDVGCGVGAFCHAAHAHGWNVTGIDIAGEAIEIGRQYATFPLYEITVEDMLKKNAVFDVVTAFEVLEHLKEPRIFLQTIRQLIKPGGHFFCTVPNWDCDAVQESTEKDWLPPIHILYFTLKALARLGHESGFDDITSGIVWTDPFPSSVVPIGKWMLRRMRHRPNMPLGLWMHSVL